MKIGRRILSVFMAIVTLVSLMGIAVEAAEITLAKLNLGYMAPTNSKGTKVIETVKLYGDYDYINFYVNSKKKDSYFFYEIYSNKDLTKGVESGYVQCDKGEYSFAQKIKLKSKYKTKTYYIVTYAAKIYSDGSAKIDKNSLCQFTMKVDKKPDFDEKIVVLKEIKNTTKGAYIKWGKLSGAQKYEVLRRSITGTKWTKVGTVSSKKDSYTDTSIKSKNGNYVYSVKAVNKKGTKSRYLYSGLTCLFAKTPKIESVNTIYNNTVEINWNKTSSKAKYNILRKEDGGDWKTIKTNCSSTTYKDKTAKNGKNYMYSVKAVISTDYGKATSSYYTDTKNTVTFLAAPTLNGVALAETGVSVSWNAVEGVSGYSVLRRPLDKSEGWTQVGAVDAAAAEFTDTTADLDSAYIYTVRSEGENGKGSYYADGIEFIVLDEPENISYSYASNIDGIKLTWQDVEFADQYNIYTMDENGQWKLVQEVEDNFNTTCYTSFVPEKYGKTQYTVTALRGGINETIISDNVCEVDFFPNIKYVSFVADKQINLSWSNYNVDGYNIYRKEAAQEGTQFELIGNTRENNFVDNSVENNILYIYQVKAISNGVEQYVKLTTHSVGISTNLTCEPQISTNGNEIKFENVTEVFGFNYKTGEWQLLDNNQKEKHSVYLKDGKYRYGFVVEEDGLKSILENCITDYDWYDVKVDFTTELTDEYIISITINNPTEEIVEYEVAVKDYIKTIKTDGSKKYTLDFDVFTNRSGVHDISIIAKNKNGNTSKTTGEFYYMDAPSIESRERKDNGDIKITIEQGNFDEIGWDGYYIYRKVYGKKNYERIAVVEKPNTKWGFVKTTFTDTTSKKGVKYVYLIKSYKNYNGVTYTSYYGKRTIQ